MKGVKLSDARAEADVDGGVYYPSSDGKPMAETQIHVNLMIAILDSLTDYFASQPKVLVAGNIFWYYEEGNPRARRSPDIMVVKGVEPKPPTEVRSFRSWRERASPCFILELTSVKTRKIDVEVKYPLYERLGVKEYFLFDPFGEHLFPPWRGFRLRGGHYRELPHEDDGSIVSRELGVRFRPDGAWLKLSDAATGELILSPKEVRAEQAATKTRLAEVEAARAVDARRIAELTAENERLRQQRQN